jgi:predicted metal-dependent hydrolase
MTEPQRHSAAYGNQTITYTLEYRERKTLAIEVHPDGGVHVIAPPNTTPEQASASLCKRANWIRQQQRTFASYPPPLPEREYVSGESWRYLGRQYRLKLVGSPRKYVRTWAGRIELFLPDTQDKAAARQVLHDWLRQRAKIIFTEQYEKACKTVGTIGIQHNKGIELRTMPNRWGSLSKNGRLLLNPALLAASKDCIEYVIVHELCHLQEHNHSARFYDLLAQCLPDWQERRQRLNRTVELGAYN